MGQILKTVAFGLLRPINKFSPILLGVFTSLWGLWLISPWWSTFGTAPLWSKMSDLAPEWAWGLWSLTAGMLVSYFTAKEKHVEQAQALGFIVFHWFTVGWLMWFGDWRNTGALTYSAISLYAAFLFLNVRINYAHLVSDWHLRRHLIRRNNHRRS